MTLDPEKYELNPELKLSYDNLNKSFYQFHRKYPTMSYYGNIPAQYSENTISWIQWIHWIEGWIKTVNDNEEKLNEDFNNFVDEYNTFVKDVSQNIQDLKDKDIFLESDYNKKINDLLNSLTDRINTIIAANFNMTPKIYPSLSDIQGAYPSGADGIFIASDTGHYYYWSNGAWRDGGLYQNAVVGDHSLNFSAIKLKYDPRGDNIVHDGVYIFGYDEENKIQLNNYNDNKHDVVEIYYNKSGIIHLKKDTPGNFLPGHIMMITDMSNTLIVPDFWNQEILTQSGVIDYYTNITDDEILIDLDRISDTVESEYKVYITIQKNVDDVITIENGSKENIRSFQ